MKICQKCGSEVNEDENSCQNAAERMLWKKSFAEYWEQNYRLNNLFGYKKSISNKKG